MLNPITPPNIIDNGIAVLVVCPTQTTGTPSTLTTTHTLIQDTLEQYSTTQSNVSQGKEVELCMEISYRKINPNVTINCADNWRNIWTKIDNTSTGQLLFIYGTNQILPNGFYRIRVTMDKQQIQDKTYYIGCPTQRMIIGLPYSIYTPIQFY